MGTKSIMELSLPSWASAKLRCFGKVEDKIKILWLLASYVCLGPGKNFEGLLSGNDWPNRKLFIRGTGRVQGYTLFLKFMNI